jgi:hypothetical protein
MNRMIAKRVIRLAAAAALLAAPLPLAAQKPGQITPDYLIGRWGDNGDCTKDIVIDPDGTFRSYTGGSGRWSLVGNRLTFAGENGTYVMRVAWEGPDSMIITNPDGSVGRSQRC